MGKEDLKIHREYRVKEKMEVKDYLNQPFLHLPMLYLCKSPNLKDLEDKKKKKT